MDDIHSGSAYKVLNGPVILYQYMPLYLQGQDLHSSETGMGDM